MIGNSDQSVNQDSESLSQFATDAASPIAKDEAERLNTQTGIEGSGIAAIREQARQLRSRGFAVARLSAKTKRPFSTGWSTRSAEPEEFAPGDMLGTQGGALSDGGRAGHSLVIVDLDSTAALDAADKHLPATGMVEGRKGKPRSHRYYLVPNDSVPDEWISKASQAATAAIQAKGHAGPAKRQFKDGNDKPAIDFIGTGGQAACPPSLHPSGELREWDGGAPGEPAVVEFPVLLDALASLLRAIGGVVTKRATPAKRRRGCDQAKAAGAADATPDSDDDEHNDTVCGVNASGELENAYALTDATEIATAERHARQYVHTIELPRSGHGGDPATLRILAILLYGFTLPREAAARVFREVVNRPLVALGDAWAEGEISRKLDRLILRGPNEEYGAIGCKLPPESPPRSWNDPDRLADEFLATRDIVALKDTAYLYADGAYAPSSDEQLAAMIHAHVGDAAVAEYKRTYAAWVNEAHAATQRVTEAETAVIAAAVDKEQLREAKKSRTAANREAAKIAKRQVKAVQHVTQSTVREVVAATRHKRQLPDITEFGLCWWSLDVKGRLVIDHTQNRRCLTLGNGLLDVDTLKVHPHTPRYFSLWRVPVNFDATAAEPTTFLTTISELMHGDAQRVAVLQELFGACLDPWLTLKFFAAFFGGGSNGKSVILAVLRAMLGRDSVSAVSVNDLAQNRFASFGLLGKLANLTGDEGYFTSKDEGKLKTLTGGDLVAFEAKGKQQVNATNTAKIIFACNVLPNLNDPTDATWNRLIPVPFNRKIEDEKKNPALLRPATWNAELPGILNWSLDGLKRLRAAGKFTRSDACEKLKREHRDTSDPAAVFLRDHYREAADGFAPNAAIWTRYRSWIVGNGGRELNRVMFGRIVQRVFPDARSDVLKPNGGVSVRGWRGIELIPVAA